MSGKKKWRVGVLVVSAMMCFLAVEASSGQAQETGPAGKTSEKEPSEESNKAVKLGEIVVTATRTKIPLSDAPASVSVVTEQDMDRIRVNHLDEALTYLVGVFDERISFAYSMPKIQLRGFNNSTSHRTLVLVDGQPQNTAWYGAAQWALFPENIERIEVVRGPFSSLYGGNAMGGVINVITKTPMERELTLKSGYGSYNTFTPHFSYGDRLWDRLSLLLGGDWKHTDGYRSDYVVKSASSGPGTTPVTGWERSTDPQGRTTYVIGDRGKKSWDEKKVQGKLVLDVLPESQLSLGINYGQYDYEYNNPRTWLKDAAGNPVNSGKVTLNDNSVDRTVTVSP
ncbi:MAG: TonB-dependent receptor plug domain-containing protein, partial [Kiritimatiellae bacterium]|nr:TonB-dependent receptor plug domain-containing protein [Kiritimatiellia bacterium]